MYSIKKWKYQEISNGIHQIPWRLPTFLYFAIVGWCFYLPCQRYYYVRKMFGRATVNKHHPSSIFFQSLFLSFRHRIFNSCCLRLVVDYRWNGSLNIFVEVNLCGTKQITAEIWCGEVKYPNYLMMSLYFQ